MNKLCDSSGRVHGDYINRSIYVINAKLHKIFNNLAMCDNCLFERPQKRGNNERMDEMGRGGAED